MSTYLNIKKAITGKQLSSVRLLPRLLSMSTNAERPATFSIIRTFKFFFHSCISHRENEGTNDNLSLASWRCWSC